MSVESGSRLLSPEIRLIQQQEMLRRHINDGVVEYQERIGLLKANIGQLLQEYPELGDLLDPDVIERLYDVEKALRGLEQSGAE